MTLEHEEIADSKTAAAPSAFGDVLSGLLERPIGAAKDPVLALSRKRKKAGDANEAEKTRREQKLRRRDIRLLRLKEHIVPDVTTNAQLERQLIRVATKGVVTLFNAVAKQQKQAKLESETEDTKGKRKKVESMSKQSFLDMLKGNTEETNTTTTEPSKQSGWNVLSDTFDGADDESDVEAEAELDDESSEDEFEYESEHAN